MVGFQQQTISSANFALLLGLSTLAFAYLGGITSVNGAIVAGLIGTGGLNTVFMRYHFEGIVNYITVFGGIGLILTSISHPGGIALFVQPLIQKLGNFVLHAKAARVGEGGPQGRAHRRRRRPRRLADLGPPRQVLVVDDPARRLPVAAHLRHGRCGSCTGAGPPSATPSPTAWSSRGRPGPLTTAAEHDGTVPRP